MKEKKKTKIYYVVNARLPTEKAHGIQIAKMCEALIAAGADVELIVPRRRTVSEDMREFYNLDTVLPLRRLPALDCYAWGIIGFWIGSLSFMCAYAAFFFLQRLRGGGRNRMMIYTTDIDQFSFSFIPLLGIPYMVEMHDAKPWSIRFWLFLRRAAGVVVINKIIREEIAAVFSIEAKEIAVHPNGIDAAFFSQGVSRADARTALRIPRDGAIAMYAGKCYPWKGLDALVIAAAASPSVHFYLAGGTRDELATAAGVGAISANITAVGHQPYRMIPVWLAAADILILTGTRRNNYSYLHTSPMKIFEYMAAGRPMVVPDTPAVREVVSEREAFFYTPDDGIDLANKIRYVFAHLDEAAIRAAAATVAVRRFSWQLRADAIMGFMRQRINYL